MIAVATSKLDNGAGQVQSKWRRLKHYSKLEGEMFGFGRVEGLTRREYNARVRNLLEDRIGIETDNGINPDFPGILKFLKYVDDGWYQSACPEDNAIYNALRYWGGCAKAGGKPLEEARRIESAIVDLLKETADCKKISLARFRQFASYYNEVRSTLVE